jgi:hypothetical protein
MGQKEGFDVDAMQELKDLGGLWQNARLKGRNAL